MIENLPRLWIYVALRISFGVDLAEFIVESRSLPQEFSEKYFTDIGVYV